jgi:hypothetical protein
MPVVHYQWFRLFNKWQIHIYIFFLFHNVSTEFLHASTSKFYILSSYISSNHFMQKDRFTHIHKWMTKKNKSNVHKSFLIVHVTTGPWCKKWKQINIKSRNDANRLPSHTKPWIRYSNIQLISLSYKFAILMLLSQNVSSTSFHINYFSFYVQEINQK